MKACQDCGGNVMRGRTSGGSYTRCLPCDVAQQLAGVRIRVRKPHAPARRIICVCCGREGPAAALGLRAACYHARRRAGTLDNWREYYA